MFTLPDRSVKQAQGEDGFTLIELLVVVAILGILIAIAIPTYLNYRKSANDKSAQSDLRNAVTVLEACGVDGAYPTVVGPTGTMTGCAGQKLTVSTNTSLIRPDPSTGTVTSFIVASTNSGGDKVYCYDSFDGGSVKDVTGPLSSATC